MQRHEPSYHDNQESENKVKIRLPGQDTPETSHSFAFFVKLKPLHTFATQHISKESLPAMHQIVSKAKNVYIHIGHDRLGNPSVPVNFYCCHFEDVWVSYDDENDGETKVLQLSSRLTSLGYTMSFYTPQALIRKSMIQ